MQPKYLAPLYETWSPPRLLYRDKELARMLKYTAEAPIPFNMWIEGKRASANL